MTTNYVLCTWSGRRRTVDHRREQEPEFYLRTHIESLSALNHSLDRVTIVVPHDPEEPTAFRSYLQSIPSKIGSAEVLVFERPNIGLSYGSLSDVYGECRTSFDYYMFIEDDYTFNQHWFDRLHAEVMEEDVQCGYLCGLAWAVRHMPLHAGVPHGMMRAAAMEKVFSHLGKLPHAPDCTYRNNEREGQIGQSRALIEEGYGLRDWSGRYRVGYRKNNFSVQWFHEDCSEVMIRPV